MSDRSSRPNRGRTPSPTERRSIKVRLARRWGPARIGHLLGLVPSTVHRVLVRFGQARLSQPMALRADRLALVAQSHDRQFITWKHLADVALGGRR